MTKEKFLNCIFSTLEDSSADYFVYGEYQNLPKSTGDSDLDMYIQESDVKILLKSIEELLKKGDVILASYFDGSTFKMFRFLSKDWGVQIDVTHSVFSYKGVVYYPIELLRSHVIYHNGIKVLDKNKGFFANFLKEIIHNGKAKEKYIDAFIAEIDSDKENYEKEFLSLYGEVVKQIIFENLSSVALKNVSRELSDCLRSSVSKGNKFKLMINKIALFKRFFQKKTGYVVVVEGTDGAGKSFIINQISPIINEGFHNGVVYNHLRPNVIPDLGVLLGKRVKNETKVVNCNPHDNVRKGVLQSIVRWSYYMIDYTFGYLKSVWTQIHIRSKVYIFDRYYYDYYIDPKRSSTDLPHWILKLGEFLVPSPDLTLCLGGDPEKIYARKPETSLEEVKRQTEALHKFCDSRKNTVWIDTTVNPEESVNAAMEAIVKMMSQRFKKVKLE
ncbi:MAG: hypothetical protein IK017_04670 [Paludibacteraceae bacterium]|nr:hypothetical protein [Paludibacteraceae bacterium]